MKDVVNPATGELLARVPLGDESTIDAAVGAAQKAFAQVRHQPAHLRSAVLVAVARGIEQRRTELVDTIIAEAGKPITLAEAELADCLTLT